MTATIALAGNPNSGKTTLFNTLTGARQHVGNYPGITVEKKEGYYTDADKKFHIVDLPGTYSLTAYSLEEVVARDFLVNEKPTAVINIVDASNLERNLYLTVQFLELGVPVCIALNMMDVAKSRGITIDNDQLSQLLGVPIVPMVARNGDGKQALINACTGMVGHPSIPVNFEITYGNDIDRTIRELSGLLSSHRLLTDTYPVRWIALKYIEKDEQILKLGRQENPELAKKLEKIVRQLENHVKDTLGTYPEALIADYRYGYIKSIIRKGIITFHHQPDRLYMSDKIDRIVTHRFMGPLIMATVMLSLYHFVFVYSQWPVSLLESFFGWISGLAQVLLPDGLLKSLIISGIIDGVGGVLGFVPLIMFMFFGISILEDSGYLARVAFMLDRVFSIFGLHGSSVMPFIVSGGIAGGCAVPGIMATRTLKSPKERLATLLTVPLMNCGAKLPVFALLVAAFFSRHEAFFMFVLTLIAWTGALLTAKLLRVTVIRGDASPFVMELPPYRFPTVKGLLIHTGERTWQYIKKAGTVILAISILLWAMMTFPQLPEDSSAINSQRGEAALRYSIAGRMGTALEGISRWAGFDWRTNIALVGGFAAKEIVVATLGTAYSLGEIDTEDSHTLSQTLAESPDWRPLTALALIIFVMFYSPCFVAVVCISKEAGSWKWGLFSVVFNTILAFSLACIVFQAGSALGF